MTAVVCRNAHVKPVATIADVEFASSFQLCFKRREAEKVDRAGNRHEAPDPDVQYRANEVANSASPTQNPVGARCNVATECTLTQAE